MRISSFVLAFILLLASVNAAVYTVNVSDPLSAGRFFPTDAKFEVETLKYDPYPVSPGDSFDVWIKVDNAGQNDAPNAVFNLVLSYPFSSKDELRTEYGRLPGVVSATKNQQPGETDMQVNQAILKYRIKVADDAPPGASSIVLNSYTNGNGGSQYSTKLPISIGKTKTDFDVVMQDSSDQGTTFAIANAGENSATAVTIKVKDQQGIAFNGAKSSIIGNLASGDFTTVNFQMAPSREVKEVTIQVSYTDRAGIRNTVEKVVPISIARAASTGAQAAQQQSQRNRSQSPSWVYGLGGFAAGLVLMPAWRRIRRKKNETE
ncbi:MAG: hypothetical protein HZB68_00120 [Candidatus Aenigmarchaeota archaeon]|nr:hypothetical protein [Candidatus Aenigmarchaeota archaeon]